MLGTGSVLPSISGRDLEGDQVDVNALTHGSWSVVLLYRGHW